MACGFDRLAWCLGDLCGYPDRCPAFNSNSKLSFDFGLDLNFDVRFDMNSDLNFDLRITLRSILQFSLKVVLSVNLNVDLRIDLDSVLRADLNFDLRFKLRINVRIDLRIDLNSNVTPGVAPGLDFQHLRDSKLPVLPGRGIINIDGNPAILRQAASSYLPFGIGSAETHSTPVLRASAQGDTPCRLQSHICNVRPPPSALRPSVVGHWALALGHSPRPPPTTPTGHPPNRYPRPSLRPRPHHSALRPVHPFPELSPLPWATCLGRRCRMRSTQPSPLPYRVRSPQPSARHSAKRQARRCGQHSGQRSGQHSGRRSAKR
jgi:hypothetical protein